MGNESISVQVNGKNFVGIGKMVFDSNADWNIPHLHFMVDKTTPGNFEATLLEFGLVSWSETQDGAITSLVKQTHSHILAVMKGEGFDRFIRTVDDHVMDGFWRNYRKIEFTLAREGRDLSHEMDSRLVRAIKAMLSEETKNFIREIAKDNAERVVAEIDRILSLTPSTLTYTEIKAAA
ncbi:hypothetical protein AGMMS49944_22980 [Spirochaetia bacterium]|nr:hypothetical protein AGMMS49944_22980 [Spirochaetia bacterium]